MQLSFIAVLVPVVLALVMAGGSSGAQRCICKDQPNTVKSHCSYASNSYFQKKGQTQGRCDFSGTAIVTSIDPSPGGSYSFPSSSSGGAGTPPSTGSGGITPPTGSGGITPYLQQTLKDQQQQQPLFTKDQQQHTLKGDLQQQPFCLSATAAVSAACLQQQPFCCPSAVISAALHCSS